MEFSLLHFLDEEIWMELEGRETHAICICGYIETERYDFITYLEPSLMYSNKCEETFD